MPVKYEAIRDKFEAGGMSREAAETHAAKIFNATRKEGQKPVTGNSEEAEEEEEEEEKGGETLSTTYPP